LESATPAVDRPSLEVDGKEVDKVLVPSPRWLGPQLPRCPLLLAQTGTIGFTRKEDNQR